VLASVVLIDGRHGQVLELAAVGGEHKKRDEGAHGLPDRDLEAQAQGRPNPLLEQIQAEMSPDQRRERASAVARVVLDEDRLRGGGISRQQLLEMIVAPRK